jgi:hypothetical protein
MQRFVRRVSGCALTDHVRSATIQNALQIYALEKIIQDINTSGMIILSRVYGSVTNNNGFWIGWLNLMTPSCTIPLNHNQ